MRYMCIIYYNSFINPGHPTCRCRPLLIDGCGLFYDLYRLRAAWSVRIYENSIYE